MNCIFSRVALTVRVDSATEKAFSTSGTFKSEDYKKSEMTKSFNFKLKCKYRETGKCPRAPHPSFSPCEEM